MAFLTLTDIEGNLHTVNTKHITHVSWGYIPDSEKVDLIYLTDNAEIALEHKGDDSQTLAHDVFDFDLLDRLHDCDDSDSDEDSDEDSEDEDESAESDEDDDESDEDV